MKVFIKIILGVIILTALPLLGIGFSGRSFMQYMEFPPLTCYIEPMPFNWAIFITIAAIEVVMYFYLITAVLTGIQKSRSLINPSPSTGYFPWWGWAGTFLCCISWVLAWTRFSWFSPLQRHTFTPLWLGYILVINAFTYKRKSSCIMIERPKRFLVLFIASAVFWWFFEYMNRFVQNWNYKGSDVFSSLEYVLFATIAFSTVLPAVISTNELLRTFSFLNQGLMGRRAFKVDSSQPLALFLLSLSGVGLALIGIFPNFLYPLLWVSPLLIVVSLQTLTGVDGIFAPLRGGDWRNLITPALSALICGFFWEMWNFESLAKWEYSLPFVTRFKIFEMPVLGYAGYLPFGLECLVIGAMVLESKHGFKICITPHKLKGFVIKQGIGVLIFITSLYLIPVNLCSRESDIFYEGNEEKQELLASGVRRWLSSSLEKTVFQTGSKKFDGEWLFGTYTLSAMGFGQLAIEHPNNKEKYMRDMEACFEKILLPEVREFDRAAWGNDPIRTLDSLLYHHAAYLGYFNLPLSLYRYLDEMNPGKNTGKSKFLELNTKITSALAERLLNSPLLLLETYPGEIYPVDNASVIGSIGLYSKATDGKYDALVKEWTSRCRDRYIDKESGLLFQSVRSNGNPADVPRGSGTALAIYFLYFADKQISEDLFKAMKSQVTDTVLGFGAVKEYPKNHSGFGDIDSGPLVFGYAVSSTGFLISGCRMHGDKRYYSRIYATACLIGAPYMKRGTWNWITGGPIGDSILFAMLTAPRKPITR